MPALSSYPNVWNSALVILQRKGFSLRFDKERQHWQAEKDGWDFLADDPLELLGLIAIYEHHAPNMNVEYWWKIDQPDLISKFDPNNEPTA